MRKLFILFPSLTLLWSCTDVPQEKQAFNPETVKMEIVQNGTKWGEAIRKKDPAIIENLYDGNAHYLADNENILNGNQAITEYWKKSFTGLADLGLNMQSLEGTREILYETGTGWAVIAYEQNKVDTFRYNYCNVWKLQPDSTYKVVIDMFNDMPK